MPKKIVLIGCSKSKLPCKSKAKDLYQGDLFRKSWTAAELKYPKADKFILSAKYGLLDPNQEIEPYDVTLSGKRVACKKAWAKKVIEQLKEKGYDLEKDLFVFYAGKDYTDFLVSPKGPIVNYRREYGGAKGNGEILHKLCEQINQIMQNFQGSFLESGSVMRMHLNVADRPGIYRLWVPQHLVDTALRDLDCTKTLSKEIEGKEYRALYVGMSKNLYHRLDWHINDEHSESAVKSGYISTLRHTIGAFLGDENRPLTELVNEVNAFLDQCYFEWEYTSSEAMAKYIESVLLSIHYYPFNIQDNPNLPKKVRVEIIRRRKAIKN